MRMRTLATALLGVVLAVPAHADIDFTDYHNPTQVDQILSTLASTYPNLATVVTIGTTGEGRPIKALKISDNPATPEPGEGDIFFVGAHHAREWLTVEMTLYLAEYLLKHYSTDAALKADMDNLEIWIVPITNPDGVAYTWDPSGDRYWRKNRRNNGDGTFGVDLNRNYSFQWGLNSGSSPDTYSEVYRGPTPFSEPETQAIRDLVRNAHNPKALVTYHTYSQLFLRPWSFTTDDAPGESTLRSHTDRAIGLMAAVHGVTYTDAIWYTSSGETTDYLWGESRTAAFTPEMRPDCCGLAGFSPPPTTIIPNSEENLPAALALIHDAGTREIWIADYPADTGTEPSAVWTGSGWTHAFWLSPDIWTVPETLNQGATVDLNVRVHNSMGSAKTNVTLETYYTDPRISLEFPNPAATLIDSRTVTLPPGDKIITVPWTVPVGTNSMGERHWCVGAVVKHATDLPLTTQAERTSNIGIRNFQTTEIVESGLLTVAATNYLKVAAELVVHIDRERIPHAWKITMPPRPDPPPGPGPQMTRRKAKLLGAKGILLEPGETIKLPLRIEAPPGVRPGTAIDVNVHAALVPLVPGKRKSFGNGYTFRVVAGQPRN